MSTPVSASAREPQPSDASTWARDLALPEVVSARGLLAADVAQAMLAAIARAAAADRALFLVRERSQDALATAASQGFSLEGGGDPFAAAADPKDAGPVRRVVEEALAKDHPIRMDVEARGLGKRSAVAIPLRAVIREGRKPGYAGALLPSERRKAAPERLWKAIGAVYLDRPGARPLETTDLDRAEAVALAAARAYALARRHEAATIDAASGCLARGELPSALDVEITVARASGQPLAVLLFGIDRFQEIVDARGRRGADAAAASVARRLRTTLRAGDLSVRHAGGNVVALLPGADEKAAEAAAARLLGSLQGIEPAHPVSCGIAVFPSHGERKGELIRKADQALLVAETERGGGRAVAWSPAIPRYALGTEKLPGIVTGDPARDRRNVLLLLDAIAAVNAIKDREHLLSTVLDMLIELTEAERGVVLTPAASSEEKDPGTGTGTGTKLVAAIAQDGKRRKISPDGIVGAVVDAVAKSHLPVASVLGAPAGDAALEAAIRERKLGLVICVPLIAGERLVGVLYVDGPEAPRELGEPDLVFFQALAREVAVALENARLYEETERARREVEELNKRLAKKVKTQAHELEEAKAVIDGEIKTKYDYGKIVGKSPKMLEVYRLLDRITDTDVPVLIQGESGTGKELVAKAIHFNGPRGRKRFVSVNCAAIAPSLLESELFGHVKGAFTGADRDKPGLFEQADQGTIFLDEVQDMPAQLQRELLRVLQEKELRRVGGKEVLPVNVRVIAAANKDLRGLMRTGVFREDLYYRMAVVTIDLPPLRERKEDIPLIVERHLRELCKAQSRAVVALDKGALRVLLRHEWPGNVRELHNVLERTLLMLDGDTITEEAVALEVRDAPRLPGAAPGEAGARPGSGGFAATGASGLPGLGGAALRPGSGGFPAAGAGGATSASGRLPAVRPGSGGFPSAAAGAGAQGPSASGRFPAARPGSGGFPSTGTPARPGSGAFPAPGASGGSGASGRLPAVRPGSGGFAAAGAGGSPPPGSEGYDPALDPDLAGPEQAPFDEGALTPEQYAAAYGGAPAGDPAHDPLAAEIFARTYKEAAEAFKAEYIRRVLATHQGNVTRASEQSGLFRSSFHKIMRKLDVSARDMRSGSGERRGAGEGGGG